ncbi:Histone deacetylase 6 [Capsicum baccatum]|uniref:histone deacetylase n=1 Tax=Capsicum baccatum TaxID=33114 RepID=A0A2G2V1F9_CAPBA|nr:Histone deacetylase 6 [Capsicum baccatum]
MGRNKYGLPMAFSFLQSSAQVFLNHQLPNGQIAPTPNNSFHSACEKLEDAGYAVGACILELLCHREKDRKTLDNQLEFVEGMKLDRGYISPYLITNQKNQKCELEDPLILIHEKKISSVNAVVRALELALRPLLIVAEDVDSEALATLILNKLHAGIKSDPMAVIYSKGRDGSLQELGRTKVVPNSLNPQLITKYTIAYHLRQCRICYGGASLPSTGRDAKKRLVRYFYDPEVGNYCYGKEHVMVPNRIRMAHNLIVRYNIHKHLEMKIPPRTKLKDFASFHSEEYIDFLSSVSLENVNHLSNKSNVERFNISEDCPVFEGLIEFCQSSAGGSIASAVTLNKNDADIVINWAGGLHHAKRDAASGFCYVNDIVLGILELLKTHKRVLYIDIDVHHGDGVEEAFFTTDRVMTVSFHQFGGNFFPGTGKISDVGENKGKYYALNVPLNDGMDDESFRGLFHPIVPKIMDVYQPNVVVLQSGADSLAGDKLGSFNLSVKGHADCLRFLRSFNVPLMVLGGGGYTITNVARCWCYETAVAVGVEPDNELPIHEYYEHFSPEYVLHVEPKPTMNKNSRKDLENIRNMLLEHISRLTHAPSVPFQNTPPIAKVREEEEDDIERRTRPIWKGVDSEDDSEED